MLSPNQGKGAPMSSAIKTQLLTSAQEKAYYELLPVDLEQLWTLSNQFIENHRLICFEYEWFSLVEQHFYLSLLTCRDVQAKLMLKRIMDKFGTDSRRIYKLRTAYVQATQSEKDLETHIASLQEIEFDARKMGMTQLKTQKKWKEFIQNLVDYLQSNNPVDEEAWAELGEAYAECGDFESAVNSFEQVLILKPLAFNVFARIGELKKLQAALKLSENFAAAKSLIDSSIDYFCRSVELNPLYLRGWCGLLSTTAVAADQKSGELHEKAKLVVQKLVKSEVGKESDVDAARALLKFYGS